MRAQALPRPLRFALPLSAAALALLLVAAAPVPPAVPAPKEAATNGWDHDWARGAVFYEVFVRSFKDSNGDGKGDLQGLIAKLDYLNDGNPHSFGDLGVDALWLMPVFRSPSYHGYDTSDYEHINPDYGTDEDFAQLLAAAHKRGMKVIVDLVMNHTSAQHPWFVDANSGPHSAKRDWYVWRTDDPGWTQPWGGTNHTWHPGNGGFYYGVFWGGMPDLNFRNPAVQKEMERLADLWLARGVDGFRLDATRHLVEDGPDQQQVDTPETHAFLKALAAHVRAVHPQAVLVGEDWTDTPKIATYYGDPAVPGGNELPMSFDFPLAEALVQGARVGQAGGIAAKLEEIARLYPKGVIDTPFLTNHDMIRVATQLGDLGKEKSAAAVLLTLPGAPFLYYGEELGLANGPGPADEQKRTPMPWDGTATASFTTGKPWFDFAPGKDKANVAAETSDPNSLLSYYRFLIRARHNSEALRKGNLTLLTQATDTTPILAFLRTTPGETVLVLHNLGDTPVEAGPYKVPGVPDPYFVSPGVTPPTGGSGAWKVKLPAHGSGVWKMRVR